MKSFTVNIPHQISLGVIKIERDEMGGGECGTYGREQKRIQSFGGETLRERDHF
jgi:hypothetical protein